MPVLAVKLPTSSQPAGGVTVPTGRFRNASRSSPSFMSEKEFRVIVVEFVPDVVVALV